MVRKKQVVTQKKREAKEPGAKKKPVDWLTLWQEWAAEHLLKRWRLKEIAVDDTVGRLLFWLHTILRNIIIQQVQLNVLQRQQENTLARLEALEKARDEE